MKLLVVDDEPGIRSLLRVAFEGDGYEIQTANNGLEAVQITEFWQPEMILMDIRMPVLNGVEALRVIRKNYPALRVVLMTAYSDTEWLSQARTMGVKDIVTKPFDIHQLRALVSDYFSLGRSCAGI